MQAAGSLPSRDYLSAAMTTTGSAVKLSAISRQAVQVYAMAHDDSAVGCSPTHCTAHSSIMYKVAPFARLVPSPYVGCWPTLTTSSVSACILITNERTNNVVFCLLTQSTSQHTHLVFCHLHVGQRPTYLSVCIFCLLILIM